jgi:hypothetical protein
MRPDKEYRFYEMRLEMSLRETRVSLHEPRGGPTEDQGCPL